MKMSNYVYIYIWFRDVLVIFYFFNFLYSRFVVQKLLVSYIYIYVELSFLLKVFHVQVRKNCVLSVVFTTRRFF